MLNKLLKIFGKTFIDSAKSYCDNVTEYYEKTQPKIIELGSNAVSSAIEGIKDLVTYKSQIKKAKEEAEKKRREQVNKARCATIVAGSVALVAGGVAGFSLAKKCSIKQSDYVFKDSEVLSLEDNYSKQKFVVKPKMFTEEFNGFKLSSDGTTMLKKA
ncbi:MAG: hypothetical protein Q4E88_03355 [Coriobacteriia bacterium]|nr:hypothetical protein [Coriobacteriia bacterium]